MIRPWSGIVQCENVKPNKTAATNHTEPGAAVDWPGGIVCGSVQDGGDPAGLKRSENTRSSSFGAEVPSSREKALRMKSSVWWEVAPKPNHGSVPGGGGENLTHRVGLCLERSDETKCSFHAFPNPDSNQGSAARSPCTQNQKVTGRGVIQGWFREAPTPPRNPPSSVSQRQ